MRNLQRYLVDKDEEMDDYLLISDLIVYNAEHVLCELTTNMRKTYINMHILSIGVTVRARGDEYCVVFETTQYEIKMRCYTAAEVISRVARAVFDAIQL